MAMFYKGNKNEFLNTVGIPYGFILVEVNIDGFAKMGTMAFDGSNDTGIYSLQQGENLIIICKAKGQISQKEIKQVRKGMAKCHLLKDMSEIIAAVLNFKLPPDFNPLYKFVLCGPSEDCHIPIKHGYIQNENGQKVSNDIDRLEVSFFTLNFMANAEKPRNSDTINNYISLLQQMAKAGLPLNEEEYIKNYNNLSEEERLVLESPAELRAEDAEYENEDDDDDDDGKKGNLPN